MRNAFVVVSIALAGLMACGDNLQGNRSPTATDSNLSTPEDTPVSITVIVTDPDGDPLTFEFSEPEHGTVTQNGGTITYRPDDDYTGADAIHVVISDGTYETDADIAINITPVNDAPVAVDDALAGNEDQQVVVTGTTLVTNDDDVEDDALTLTAVANPSTGTVGLVSDTIRFTPPANFVGSATFEYTVSDGDASDVGQVTITVGGVNDAPVAVTDAVTTAEDMPATITAATLVANDTDAEGQTLSVTGVSNPMNGTVGIAGGTITFTPTLNFSGAARFSYTVSDGAASATGTVNVTVTPVNDTPVANAQSTTVNEDASVTITLTGSDVEGSALTFSIVAQPTAGTLGTITPVNATSATVVYTPNANSSADDSFTFRVRDGALDSAPATVTIDVTPANDAPIAMPQVLMTPEDMALTITLSGGDIDGDPLTFAIASPPTSGTLGTITQATPTTATVVYTPNGNFNGGDSFTFTVNDGTATSTAATVMITMTPVNDGPVATAQNTSCAEDTACTITLAGTDIDGNPLTFAIAMPPSAGSLGTVTQATPTTATVTYTSNSNSVADDSFTFTVNDGTATSAPATVAIDVTPVNDPPIAVNDSDTVERNTPRTQPFSFYLANDSDGGDGGPLTITNVSMGTNGTVAIAGGTITFTPATDYVGPASFVYTLSDGTDSTTASVSLTVVLNNTPVIAVDDIENGATEDAPLVRQTSAYLSNDIDPDPQTLTMTLVHDAVNGTVDLTGTTITFTPDANFSGVARFDYTVSDGFSTDVGRVTVNVGPVNDAPDAVDDVATVAEDGSVDVSVLANDTNDDGAVTISGFTQGTNGTVTQTLNTLTYAPAANFHGTDTFTYTIQDAGSLSDTATVTVTVTPVNDRPIFADTERTIPENAPVTLNLSATDVDVPVQNLTFTVSNPPDFGTLGAITPTGPTTATVVYTPNANYVGDDFMHFTVSDGALSDLGIVVLHITNVAVCNDGLVETPEECDDQGNTAGDGCSPTCLEEQGWDCSGAPSNCDTICGDAFVVVGVEECDDGVADGDELDGCTSECQAGVVCGTSNAALAAGDSFAVNVDDANCYVSFDDEQTTFANAQTACIAAGGHLVSITSASEQALVAGVHNLTQEPWIGLTDAVVEGSFGWITGEAMSLNNFGPAQPDGGEPEDCVNLTAVTSTWNDTSCTFVGFTDGRICELPANACGDGFIQAVRGEQCDDDNQNSSDGCSATCQIEAGAVCSGAPSTCAKLVINEIEYDAVGNDNANEYLEIFNAGTATAVLTNHAVVLANGGIASPAQYSRVNLSGTLAAGAYALVCPSTSTVGNCGPYPLPPGVLRFLFGGANDQIQNGATDAAGIFVISGTVATPVDLVSYEGTLAAAQITGITGTSPFTEGPGIVVGEDNAVNLSIQRLPNGRDTQNNNADFGLRLPTPGGPSSP